MTSGGLKELMEKRKDLDTTCWQVFRIKAQQWSGVLVSVSLLSWQFWIETQPKCAGLVVLIGLCFRTHQLPVMADYLTCLLLFTCRPTQQQTSCWSCCQVATQSSPKQTSVDSGATEQRLTRQLTEDLRCLGDVQEFVTQWTSLRFLLLDSSDWNPQQPRQRGSRTKGWHLTSC